MNNNFSIFKNYLNNNINCSRFFIKNTILLLYLKTTNLSEAYIFDVILSFTKIVTFSMS